mmetsp:Transcript_9322/g.16997  ORF Transcript_9322/g.16997 Transcript_9322/m.16997 type:complete len:251 (+) Transcript_9322:92-844(+)
MQAHGWTAGLAVLFCLSATLPEVCGDTDLDVEEPEDANTQSEDSAVILMQMELGMFADVREFGGLHMENASAEDARPDRVVAEIESSGALNPLPDSKSAAPLQMEYTKAESWTQRVMNEIHFEVNEAPTTLAQKSKAVFALLEAFFFPAVFGMDRCYMNQPCMGLLKGVTIGGFGIWFFVDYVTFVINAMEQATTIETLGFYAHFGDGQLKTAMTIALVSLCVKILSFMFCGNRVVKVSYVQKPETAAAP